MEKKRLNTDIAKAINDFKAVVNDFFLKKEFHSLIFKTRGLEFEGFKKYSLSDDATAIDWKASARTNNLLVREYKQERDLKVLFLIDVGDNMIFGSQKKLKCEYCAEISAALASFIRDYNDNVGFILFNSKLKKFIPFGNSEDHLMLIFDELTRSENYGGKSDLNFILEYIMNNFDETVSSIFIFSDFVRINEQTKQKITLFSSKYDTIAVRITDPLDRALPKLNKEIVIQDPFTGTQILLNPSVAKKTYDFYAKKRHKETKSFLKHINIDLVDLDTSESFLNPLSIFLRERVYKVI